MEYGKLINVPFTSLEEIKIINYDSLNYFLAKELVKSKLISRN